MTGKTFFNAVVNGKADILGQFLTILRATKSDYCVIGGLAVNAYAEPVVSLDLDVVIAANRLEAVRLAVSKKGFKVESFEHSLNLRKAGSDLRIQIQTDARYQLFIPRARPKNVLGYRMNVAAVEDVLRGKIWACQDAKRRPSKRQKDLADIMRVLEIYPAFHRLVPAEIKKASLQIDK